MKQLLNKESPVITAGFFIGASWPLRLLFCLSIAAACTRVDKKYLNQVVLKVNGQTLTAQAFSERLARKLRNYDAVTVKSEPVLSRAKEEVVRDYVIFVLTTEWAQKNRIEVSPKEVDQEVDKVRKSYPDDLSFRRALAAENLSFQLWQDDLRFSLLQRKVTMTVQKGAAQAPEAELQQYYSEHKSEFERKEQVRLRQILLDKEDSAELVLKELNKGANFEDLARKFSIAPDAESGGDTGWLEKGTLDVFDTAFKLPVGARSGVLKSPYGYHIIKVVQKTPARHLSFLEAKDKIRGRLMEGREQALYTAWLEGVVRSAKVERNVELVNAIKVETRGDN